MHIFLWQASQMVQSVSHLPQPRTMCDMTCAWHLTLMLTLVKPPGLHSCLFEQDVHFCRRCAVTVAFKGRS